MKKIKLVLVAIVAVLTFSCSSDSSSSNNNNDSTYIKFKVNGTQVNLIEPSTITSLMASISASEDLGTDIRSIFFTIPVDVTLGAHAITDASPSDLTAYSVNYSLGDTYVTATSGTMTVTSIGAEYMEGTFSFTGVDNGTTYNITEGAFRAYKPTSN
ncbi:hypothetical protein [Flavobacterium sp.]|uniref:hypothetical protein n=1 Tax=Flavobacterium sp. TaxID=239 RepID=UPI0024872392|nr:hypothetical protein [Flavobacterium sp.]MDI1316974.1 hypothetical protein [Flavobacterium sp.]